MFEKYKRLIMFDTETTGLSASDDSILELACLEYYRESNKERFILKSEQDIFIRNRDEKGELIEIPEKITELTGITQDMIREQGIEAKDVFAQIFKAFYFEQDETLLVAYNMNFDFGFLQKFFLDYDKGFYLNQDVLDPMAIYKDRQKFPHKLKDAIAFYKCDAQNTHRAIDDVDAMFKLILAMGRENDNINGYVNHLGYNAKYGIGTRIPRVHYIAQAGGRREIERHAFVNINE